MIFSKTTLILEDNLLVLSKILNGLWLLEQDQPYELSTIVLTNFQQVEDYINSNPKASFDIALLDRDCKLGRSFHNLDIERFGAEKIISVSSVPEYNEDTRKRGVQRVVFKDYQYLDDFVAKVVKEVAEMIREFTRHGLKSKK